MDSIETLKEEIAKLKIANNNVHTWREKAAREASQLREVNAALLEILREIEDESSTHDYSITAINGMAQDALTQYDTAPKEDKTNEDS